MPEKRACAYDIDGLPNVRTVEHHYCGDCGRPVIWTRTGWHHDPMFTEAFTEALA